MKPSEYQSTIPSLPKEDKPSVNIIRAILTIFTVCCVWWFIDDMLKNDGSFFNDIAELFSEEEVQNVEFTSEIKKMVEEDLSMRYDDSCSFYKNLQPDLPGGLFKCEKISDTEVYAYVVADEDNEDVYSIENGYLFAKYFDETENFFADIIKVYYPNADVKLVNSTTATSTWIDKDVYFYDFIKGNLFDYHVEVSLPRDTGISINNNTAIANKLSSAIPNFVVTVNYAPDELGEEKHVFSITSSDGDASVSM